MKIFIGLVLLILMPIERANAWFCSEGTSRRVGTAFESCGVAMEPTEAAARKVALQNALEEFRLLCIASDDCRDRAVSVEPRRTECLPKAGRIECRRMVRIEILAKEAIGKQEDRKIQPGRGEKVYVGQPLDKALHLLGTPNQILETDGARPMKILHFMNRPVCAFQSCSLVIENDRVVKQSGLRGDLFEIRETRSLTSFLRKFFGFEKPQ